ncbi:MAG: 50S ribosomal protein L18Ae [Sulfolobales archaeon]
MSEVKIFRVTGLALFGHDRYPEWRKFVIETRALGEKDALEKIYSLMGSRHKLKRSHIKILKIEEISIDDVRDPVVRELSRIEGFEVV